MFNGTKKSIVNFVKLYKNQFYYCSAVIRHFFLVQEFDTISVSADISFGFFVPIMSELDLTKICCNVSLAVK